MDISIDYEKLLTSKARKILVKRLIVGSAVSLTLMPLIAKDLLNNNAKLALALSGLITSLCCFKLPKYDYEQKLIDTYENTSLKEYKLILQSEILKHQTQLEISNQQEIAKTVENLPDHQIDYFAVKYGVAPIVSKYYIAENSEDSESVNTASKNSENIEQPLQPTLHIAKSANSEWINTLVYEFTLPQGKRLHEHLMINGGTQAGKSTLVSVLIAKIISAYKNQGRDTYLNLIDPKYPMTRWAWEPTYKGFEQVMTGIEQAIKELDNRKTLALKAKENKLEIPVFYPYICVIDEWDICYGNKKGYSNVIDKNDAENLLAYAKRIISEGAAYDVRLITIGQSPLTQDNGINRSLAKQTTRIVVGQEGLSWLQDPGFPFKSDASDLIDEILPLLKDEKRTALICPNKGSVKVFEIPAIELRIPENVNKDSVSSDSVDTSVEKIEDKHKSESPLERIISWCKACKEQHGRYPSLEHIKQVWKEATGKDLDDKGTALLREYLYKSGIEI